jgi:hypothetical protein
MKEAETSKEKIKRSIPLPIDSLKYFYGDAVLLATNKLPKK